MSSATPSGSDATHTKKPPKLLDQVRSKCRLLRLAKRTEEAYVGWIRRYIFFHDVRHPREKGAREVAAFLTHLAVQDQVASSTQNQALSALLFHYRHVPEKPLPAIDALRAKQPARPPVALALEEVREILRHLERDPLALVVELLYGEGLRLLESCRLRIKDVDFSRGQIVVREAKGDKDRVVLLPRRLVAG